jgi:hypothetical protein
MLDLMKDEDAYFYGLLLTDGNSYLSTRNRGKITLEVIDKDIVGKIHERYGGSISQRTRDTNFKNNFTAFAWRNSQIEFRNELFSYGFPNGNKQYSQSVPNISYNEVGFWRGIVDGNGSLGMTKGRKFPFLSLTTKSELLKNSYLDFLYNNFGIRKHPLRNRRDNIYNICINKEDAQIVSKFLYENSSLFIQRKYNNYLLLLKWVRPKNMPIRGWLSNHQIS